MTLAMSSHLDESGRVGNLVFNTSRQYGSTSHWYTTSNFARSNPRSNPPMPEKKDATFGRVAGVAVAISLAVRLPCGRSDMGRICGRKVGREAEVGHTYHDRTVVGSPAQHVGDTPRSSCGTVAGDARGRRRGSGRRRRATGSASPRRQAASAPSPPARAVVTRPVEAAPIVTSPPGRTRAVEVHL